ncbi:MAG: hypothetical protein V7637_4153 [Mycobacteriales bacterium]|jgi:hypothetical protein
MISTRERGAALPAPAKVNAAAMVAAIAGIVVQLAAGVDYPTVPPGPIILAVAVGIVVFVRRPWASLVGVAVPLFLVVGGVIAASANSDNALRQPSDVAAFTGTVVQLAAVAVALAAGLQALRRR